MGNDVCRCCNGTSHACCHAGGNNPYCCFDNNNSYISGHYHGEFPVYDATGGGSCSPNPVVHTIILDFDYKVKHYPSTCGKYQHAGRGDTSASIPIITNWASTIDGTAVSITDCLDNGADGIYTVTQYGADIAYPFATTDTWYCQWNFNLNIAYFGSLWGSDTGVLSEQMLSYSGTYPHFAVAGTCTGITGTISLAGDCNSTFQFGPDQWFTKISTGTLTATVYENYCCGNVGMAAGFISPNHTCQISPKPNVNDSGVCYECCDPGNGCKFSTDGLNATLTYHSILKIHPYQPLAWDTLTQAQWDAMNQTQWDTLTQTGSNPCDSTYTFDMTIAFSIIDGFFKLPDGGCGRTIVGDTTPLGAHNLAVVGGSITTIGWSGKTDTLNWNTNYLRPDGSTCHPVFTWMGSQIGNYVYIESKPNGKWRLNLESNTWGDYNNSPYWGFFTLVGATDWTDSIPFRNLFTADIDGNPAPGNICTGFSKSRSTSPCPAFIINDSVGTPLWYADQSDTLSFVINTNPCTGVGQEKPKLGLGTAIKNVTSAIGITPCKACEERAKKLDVLIPNINPFNRKKKR